MTEYGLFLNGGWQAALHNRSMPSVNPATAEPWAKVAAAAPEDVDVAVTAARRAFDSGVFRDKPREERAAILNIIAAAIFDRTEELALAESLDGGATLSKSTTADVPTAGQAFLYYAELLAGAADEERFTEETPVKSTNVVRREPYGVCACITPFNFPLVVAAWKLAPALAAGNAVVLKPSPYTPVTTLLLAELCHQAGVPPGVVNVITGEGPELGAALCEHPGVDMITFTGSTKVGMQIMTTAARSMKKLTLELGGKSANIILADADLDAAVKGALFGIFFHSGQVCGAGSRILVHESVHDQFVEKMIEGARRIRLGDPRDPTTTMGPLVSSAQLANVDRYVRLGVEEGARCVLGGRRCTQEGLVDGYFYEPTIFCEARNDMRMVKEEIFGPVAAVLSFRDDEEALRLANESSYGLCAGVWSNNAERARAMADRLQAGTVWINDYLLVNIRFPFGGYKQSGLGRELGPHGLYEYQQLKHIHIGEANGPGEKFYFDLLLA